LRQLLTLFLAAVLGLAAISVYAVPPPVSFGDNIIVVDLGASEAAHIDGKGLRLPSSMPLSYTFVSDLNTGWYQTNLTDAPLILSGNDPVLLLTNGLLALDQRERLMAIASGYSYSSGEDTLDTVRS
jgi:hypothetical protein